MRSILFGAAVLVIASPPALSQADPLKQLEGLWTVEWISGGNMKLEQVTFVKTPIGGHRVTLPFFPGLASVTLDGSHGADIKVSGTGFDCFYAYSIYNKNEFAWTSKGGTGGCPPSAKFRKDPAL
jgi:hypothetical protein